VSDESCARLGEYFTEAQLVELTFIIRYHALARAFAKAF